MAALIKKVVPTILALPETPTAKEDGKELKTIPKGPHLDPLASAVQALYNTGKKLVYSSEPSELEFKLGYDRPKEEASWSFDSTVVAAMRGLLKNKTYKFMLSRASTFTSGTGTMTINTSTNLTQYNEGAALIALFDECAMISGRMEITPGTTGGTNSFSEFVCFYPSEDSSTPTVSSVTRVDECRLIPTGFGGSCRINNHLTWKCPGRLWGYTIDEGVSAPRIVSGFNGTWKMIVAVGTPSNSTTYFGYLVKVVGKFRSRT